MARKKSETAAQAAPGNVGQSGSPAQPVRSAAEMYKAAGPDVKLPPFVRSERTAKKSELDKDPTVLAQPEYGEHGLTDKKAPENRTMGFGDEGPAKKGSRSKEK